MQNQPPPLLVALLLGSAGLSFFLASWAWQHRRTNGGLEMAFMMAAVAIYTLGYSFEISRSDLEGAMAAIRFEYIGSVWVTPLFFAFAWRYANERPLPRLLLAFIVLHAMSTLAVVWSPLVNTLFYESFQMNLSPPFPTIQYRPGPWFRANYYLLQAEGAAGILLIIVNAFRASPFKRLQNVVIAMGAMFPLVATIGFVLGLTPERIDVTPFALSLTGLVCSIALLKLDVLEIVPAARALAIDSLRDGFIVTDETGKVRDANEAARSLLESKLSRGASLLPGSSALHRSWAPLYSLTRAGTGAIEFIAETGDKKVRHVSANAQPVMDKGKRRGTALLIHDFTETAELTERLEDLAKRDPLTKVFNRRYVMELGRRELELAYLGHYALGVAIVDIDRLGNINKERGFQAGDKVLTEAAQRVRAAVRTIDLVGRYGGDEFVILMPGADAAQSLETAQRVRAELARTPVDWGRFGLTLTAGVGIAVTMGDKSDTLGALLLRADSALDAAKKAGRDSVKTAQ